MNKTDLMKQIELEIGMKLNWANVLAPFGQRNFEEWAARELFYAKFPIQQRVCAIANKVN